MVMSAFEPTSPTQATGVVAQGDWLQSLSRAGAFTNWVISEVSPWLSGRVLEVGCGIGTYTIEIAKSAREVISFDLEGGFVDQAAQRVRGCQNVKVFCGDATRFDLAAPDNGGFDAIVVLDVLEHIENDAKLVERLVTRLAPGGYLILKVPAMSSLYSPMDAAIGHLRRYDKTEIRNLIDRSGLEDLRVWSFNAFAVPAWWWNGRVLKRRSCPARQVALFNRLIPVLRPLDQLARLFCGISFFAVARRSIGPI
jgi:SAM-dependent methyltransferase